MQAVAVDRSGNSRGWALVTGASDGIGRACTIQLAAEGWSLLLVARSQARLEQVCSEAGLLPERAMLIPADLTAPSACAEVVRRAATVPVRAAILAAGFGTSGPFFDGQLGDELGMIDLNCRAVAQLAHGLGQQMAARRNGTLVLMGSLVGFQGVAGAANYAATKAYVQTLAEGLMRELKSAGVNVLAIAPGPVQSGFAARARMTMGATDRPETVASGIVRALGTSGTIRPGGLSKLLGGSLALMPRSARSAILGRVMAGMTAGGHG
jgi:hypothetical protein